MVALDLDGFKAVNDTAGHAAGDAVLMAAAAAWVRRLRPGDVLARVGGDEFVAVMPDCDLAEAQHVARRLVDATPQPVTVSVGLAYSSGAEDPVALLAEADEGVYRSKRSGGAASSPSAWSPAAEQTEAVMVEPRPTEFSARATSAQTVAPTPGGPV